MKTMFDQATRDELVARVKSLDEQSRPLWGKMTIFQMTKHCTIWNDWVLGIDGFVYKQDFLGIIFGRMALRANTKDDTPMSKNMPAGSSFIVREKNGEIKAQVDLWVRQINSYQFFSNPDFVHDFFGRMTKEQIGIFAYKHNDHHLRQFNA